MVRFAKIAKIVAALLCIACVLALCIAPYVDIPLTVLKSLQLVLLLMGLLSSGVLLLATLFHQVSVHYALLRSDLRTPARCLVQPLESNCIQRC